MSRTLGSGTLCGWALGGGLLLAADASANAGGCARLTVGSGKLELAGACARDETAATPLAERLWAPSGVEDAFAAVVEAAPGWFEALEDPRTTGPTASSESAARGLVESNEADVELLDVACAVLSVPDVADVAATRGSDVALEDPAEDGFETAEGVPWVLAEPLPPAPAELNPDGRAELVVAGAETPGLVLADGGIKAAVFAETGADAEAAMLAEVGADAEAAVLTEAGMDAPVFTEAGAEAAEVGALAADCWPFGAVARICAAVVPIGWLGLEDPEEACGTRDAPA